jgi:hypothetical protein
MNSVSLLDSASQAVEIVDDSANNEDNFAIEEGSVEVHDTRWHYKRRTQLLVMMQIPLMM